MIEEAKPSTEERLAQLEETTAMLLRNQKKIVESLKQTQETADETLRILKTLKANSNDNHSN
jgi:hypothetical protein